MKEPDESDRKHKEAMKSLDNMDRDLEYMVNRLNGGKRKCDDSA